MFLSAFIVDWLNGYPTPRFKLCKSANHYLGVCSGLVILSTLSNMARSRYTRPGVQKLTQLCGPAVAYPLNLEYVYQDARAAYLDIHEFLCCLIFTVQKFSLLLLPIRHSIFLLSFTMRSCHKALVLAFAIVISFWVSFVFGGKQTRFNDWHYDYNTLSYGLNRDGPHGSYGKIPSTFKSSRGYTQQQLMGVDETNYR